MPIRPPPTELADCCACTVRPLPSGFAVACLLSAAAYLVCSDGLHEYVRFLIRSVGKVLERLL